VFSNAQLADNKIERLALGHKPRVLELCSGCGGLSLGLKAAGFELSAHIELDPGANQTYALNFGPKEPGKLLEWSRPRDMVSQTISGVMGDFGLAGAPNSAFDVLAAGLPCQAFARIGRSKLRSITGDEEAFKNDPRASLYRRFLEIVEETRPLAILVENVPDIMNFGGRNVPEEISASLAELGYVSKYTLLNSAFYGVPQLRERLFILAIDARLAKVPEFPDPTHFIKLPKGYDGTRAVALKFVPEKSPYFVGIPAVSEALPAAISVHQAIKDLPFISDHLRDTAVIKRRKVQEKLPYRENSPPSQYAITMRDWAGFTSGEGVSGNVIRITPRDFATFGRMPRGADYPVALGVAQELLEERLAALSSRPAKDSLSYLRMESSIVPPYDVDKFPNRWWKLDPVLPSRTLTAHLGKDTYSHIHYDGHQKRMISVREGARLQSFPDAFEFSGAMNASFKQIGNAVPPLLGFSVAASLMRTLSSAVAEATPAGCAAA
jgi:DNA (cytosine-5)-methyltransferase 1